MQTQLEQLQKTLTSINDELQALSEETLAIRNTMRNAQLKLQTVTTILEEVQKTAKANLPPPAPTVAATADTQGRTSCSTTSAQAKEPEEFEGNLDALAYFVKSVLPLACVETQPDINWNAGVVSFGSLGKRFVVTLSLQVFEQQDNKLLISTQTVLLQSIFFRHRKSIRAMRLLHDTMGMTHELIRAKRPEAALALLANMQATAEQECPELAEPEPVRDAV